MFQIIDKYIIQTFLLYFLAGLVVFVTIFLAVDVLSMTMRFPNADLGHVGSYYLYGLPELIMQMIPVACLVGALFTLSQLNSTSELVALYASGLSLSRISAPIIFTVAVVSGSSFLLFDQVNPQFSQKKNYLYYVEIKKNPGQFSIVRTDKIWYRSKNLIFNIKTLNGNQGVAQGLTMYIFSNSWQLLQMITAKEVKLKGPEWKLLDGSITIFTDASSFPLTSKFSTKQVVMDEEVNDIQASANSTDMLSASDLKRYIEKNKEAGLDTVYYEVGYFQKFAQAFSAIVMALLGIPFAVTRSRAGGTMVNIGICLVLVFAFWTLNNALVTLGRHGSVPPIISAWGANGIMAFIGMFFMQRKKA